MAFAVRRVGSGVAGVPSLLRNGSLFAEPNERCGDCDHVVDYCSLLLEEVRDEDCCEV